MAGSIFFRSDAKEKGGQDEDEHALLLGSKNESTHEVILNGINEYTEA
jgi:hypothetical protein